MKSKLGILFALVLGLAITGSTFAQDNQTMMSKDKTSNSKMTGKMTAKSTTKKSKKHHKKAKTSKMAKPAAS